MNTDNTRGTDSGSHCLGAVLKEQRGLHTAVPDVEYEIGNAEHSSSASEGEDGEDSTKRVVMMYDEEGNATPMPMARFYYDSVQPQSAANGDAEDESDNTAAPIGNAGRDTIRSNVPAPFNGKVSLHSSSKSTSEEEDVDINNMEGRNFVADDSEYDELDEEEEELVADEEAADEAEEEEAEEEDPNDRFRNQFMRIEIAATGLKDVKRVKKDLDHDKPKKKTGANKKTGIRVGLQRAVSTVKIGDGGRPRAATSASALKASAAPSTLSKSSQQQITAKQLSKTGSGLSKTASGLSRMISLTRGKSDRSPHDTLNDTSLTSTEENVRDRGAGSGLQRARESTAKPARRQGLAAVGRMISINKQKGSPSSKSTSSTLDDLPAPIADRAGPGETGDRPHGSKTLSPGMAKPAGRAGIAQVGRLLSLNKRKPTASAGAKPRAESETDASSQTVDRDRRETEVKKPSATRMGLTKLGRVISFNRAKPANDTKDDGSVERVSPLSSSTVSTGVDSPSGDRTSSDRDRARSSSSNVKKEPSRMKVASRMLSFSRKPGQSSRQGRTLMAANDGKREKQEKRSQSVPAGAPQGGPSGQKLDGRGDKFFFSEINSEKVRQSGLLNEVHIRVPVIAMAEYSGPVSRTKWYIDGFTLPHNAVRRECIDLYEILISMARCKGNTDICKDDMDDFEDWWKVASGFFSCYFDMERRVLFPWVDSAGSKDWEVQMALRKMRSMKDKLQEQLQQVDRLWNEKTFKEVGEMFALIYKAVDELVPRLMNYFADQEVLLPAIVKGYYRLDDRLKMDKDMMAVFMGDSVRKDKDSAHHNLILLIRWIGNPRQLRAWIGKNLSSSARNMYPRWYALYEEDHLRIVKQVKSKAKAGANVS